MTFVKKLSSFLLVVMASSGAVAGTCEIQYERTACPGKEAISFKKCDGAATCSDFVEVASAAECQAKALKACANDRLTITKSKVIKAKFDEQTLTSEGGKEDFCLDYAKRSEEFDHCGQ